MKTFLISIVAYVVMFIIVKLESRYVSFKIIYLILLGAFTVWYWYDEIKNSMKK